MRRRRQPYWQTRRWRNRNARFRQLPRARWCAACGTTRQLVTHHLSYAHAGRGRERTYELARLCQRCHRRVHRLSACLFFWTVLFSRRRPRTHGLWITTPTVIAATRLFGRQHTPNLRQVA
jgi:hypothetical protein